MSLRQRLELRQSQQLVLTPQLRQAIQMLQMSTLDLGVFLADEIARNPLLELADRPRDGVAPAAPPAPEPPAREPVDAAIGRADVGAVEAPFDTGRENLFEPDAAGPDLGFGRPGRGGGGGDEVALDGDAGLAAPVSLARHVAAQIGLARLPPEVRRAAELLAHELDDAGYLRIDPAEAAARLGVAPATLAAASDALRRCEPTGVGARDLAECLGLQLAERDRLDPAMQALLAHLDQAPVLPAARFAALVGVDAEDLADMMAELRRLDPRPGLRFGAAGAEPVTPDVLATPDGAGGWRVALNPDAMPRLLIDRSYAARVGGAGGRETRLFLAECAQSASWLKRSLDQRARTILSVAAEIVRAQSGFLDRGVSGLKPMTLRAVADAVGVHESTVSRVTSNKYMATPRGNYELKFFFTTAVGGGEGADSHSAEAVRGRIRDLVAAEAPERPLSDDQLMALLRAEGVEVARRTVAKYREALRIPSSTQRRRRGRAAV